MVLLSGCTMCANHMCKEEISLDVHSFHTLVVTIGQFPATTKKIELGVRLGMRYKGQENICIILGLKMYFRVLTLITLVLLAFFAGVVGVRWGGNG